MLCLGLGVEDGSAKAEITWLPEIRWSLCAVGLGTGKQNGAALGRGRIADQASAVPPILLT